MKKLRMLALLLVISISSTFFTYIGAAAQETLPIYYDFAENELGSTPTEIDCVVEFGSAEIVEYGGKKCVFIENDAEGKYAGVSKQFEAVSDCAVQIQFSYLQRYVRSNGATVFSLNNGSDRAIEIVTKDNNIVAFASNGTETILVEKFSANKWYEFYIYADLTTDRYDLIVNEDKFYSLGFKTVVEKCDSINFSTRYSPGFCVTEIGITKDQPLQKIEVTGPDKLYVMHERESIYEYTALLRNVFGAEVKEAKFKFEIEPETDGITLQALGNKAIVKVSQGTSWRGVIGINVTATDGVNEISEKKYVNVLTQEISKITFDGVRKIAYGINKDNTFVHKVVFKNNEGAEVDAEDVVWEHNCTDSKVEITTDGEVMYIKVHGELKDMEKFHVKATLKSNTMISAERDIYTYSGDTYESDAQRLSILEESIDLLFNEYAANPYNDAPLLASFVNLNTGRPAEFDTVGYEDVVMSNFAQLTGMYRVLDALATITDDANYANTVDETYQWYIDNAIADNGLGYWGGHSYIDMKTLEDCYTYSSIGLKAHHELKQHGLYLDPFFRLSPEIGEKIVKGTWLAHVYDWETLFSNRHGEYNSNNSESVWYEAESFKQITNYIQDCSGAPFRDFCGDLMNMAGSLYENTGDNNGLLWAENLLSCLYNLQDENTGMIPSLYATAKDAPGIKGDPDILFPNWWTTDTRVITATNLVFGDRFYNQYAKDLVKQGFYPASVLEKNDLTVTQGREASAQAANFLNDLVLADLLGEKGIEYKKKAVEHTAAYVRHFWNKNTTKFDKGMIDGVNLKDFEPTRNGYMSVAYYGKDGTKFGTTTINGVDYFNLLCKCYDIAKEYNMTEDAKTLKEIIDFYSEYNYKIGILGEEEIGDVGTKLNFGTQCNKPKMVLALLDLYDASDKLEFLQLARVVANNYINSDYKYGVFSDTDNNYVNIVATPKPGGNNIYYVGGYNYIGYYALARLEAYISGVENEIPPYEVYDGYLEDVFLDSYQDRETVTTDRDWINRRATNLNEHVKIKEILCEEEVILTVGETKKLAFSYLPLDYTESTGLMCLNLSEDIVHFNEETSTLVGISPGKAEIKFYAGSNKIEKTVKVTVQQKEGK